MSKAMENVGHKLPQEIHSLLQTEPSATPSSASKALVSSGDREVTTVTTTVTDDPIMVRAIAFLNERFVTAREELDLKLFECGYYKISQEAAIMEIQARLDSIAEQIGEQESLVEHFKGIIFVQTQIILVLQDQHAKSVHECAITRATLEATEKETRDDKDVILMIFKAADTVCSKPVATTPFMLAQQKSSSSNLLQVLACVGENGMTKFQFNDEKLQQGLERLHTEQAKNAAQFLMYSLYSSTTGKLPSKLDIQQFGADADPNDFHDDDPADTSSDVDESDSLSLLQTRQTPTSDGPSSESMQNKCPRTGSLSDRPKCTKIMEELDTLKSEVMIAWNTARQELETHNTECKNYQEEISNEIAKHIEILNEANEGLMTAESVLAGLQSQKAAATQEFRVACEGLREMYKTCQKELKEKEDNACTYVMIRQQVFDQNYKDPTTKAIRTATDPVVMIVDCVMGDWVIGPCSSSCKDLEGKGGEQWITREEMGEWNTKCIQTEGVQLPASCTMETGKFGASCPPNRVQRDCANVECPKDCKEGPWYEWGECSKLCGSGSKDRTRDVVQEGGEGGAECGELSESTSCNTESCNADCELSEWYPWGPCSRGCRWRRSARQGRQARIKTIQVAAKGTGECPKPSTRKRYQTQRCNPQVCPRNVDCAANVDLIIVLDSSGSLWKWDRLPRSNPLSKAGNFLQMQKFVVHVIKHSDMACRRGVEKIGGKANPIYLKTEQEACAGGEVIDGMRIGVIEYSQKVKVTSELVTAMKKKQLMTAVKAMKWMRRWTNTGKAIAKAAKLFQSRGMLTRMSIMMLITDGRPSHRWNMRKQSYLARKAGIKIMVVPVGYAGRNRKLQREMCSAMATKPCNENMLIAGRFSALMRKFNWFISSFCPIMEIHDPANDAEDR